MGNLLWLASYPKSGNTWVRAFLENYVQDPPGPVDINVLFKHSLDEAKAWRYAPYTNGRPTIELSIEETCVLRPRVQADMAAKAHGTEFAKTHNFFGEYAGFPLQNPSVTAGAIYIVRNPLDVVISMAGYFGLNLDEAIDFMGEEMTGSLHDDENVSQVISSWSMNVRSWTEHEHEQMLVIRYEDMLDKPEKVFAKVVAFLGMDKDKNRLNKAIKFSSFDQLKAQEQKHGFIERQQTAQSFFREGRKNQWRQKLNDAQIKKIIDQHGDQMERFKYIPQNGPRSN